MKKFFGRISGAAPLSHTPGTRQARLDALRQTVRQLLDDCQTPKADLLRFKIDTALDAPALWQLRSDIHMCIAREIGEGVAGQRINSLLSHFEGWLPANQLVPVAPGGS